MILVKTNLVVNDFGKKLTWASSILANTAIALEISAAFGAWFTRSGKCG